MNQIVKIFLQVVVIVVLIIITLLFVAVLMRRSKTETKIVGWEFIIVLGGIILLLGISDDVEFTNAAYMAIGLGLIIKSILKIIDLKIERKERATLENKQSNST